MLAVLLENAEEGCANETYAAVVATRQAACAPNARLRRLFVAIAQAEQRHAALAHRIHAWGKALVSNERQSELETALRFAVTRMQLSPKVTALGRAKGEPEASLARAAFDYVSSALTA